MFYDGKTDNHFAKFARTLSLGRLFVLFAICICCVGFVSVPDAAAQERKLVLRGDISSVPLAPFMARIRDPKSEMSSRKVIDAFDRGEAEYAGARQSKLGFGLDGTPSWFVLNIKNETDEEKFIFSLTQDLLHSQGAVERVVLYGADQDNREMTAALDAPFFKFDIPKNADILLLLYINPADYMPLVLTPRISTENNFFILHDAQTDGFRAALFLFLGIGFASFLAYIFKSPRFIPHLLCYCVFGILLISAKLPMLHDGFFEFFHPFLLLLIITTMGIGTFLQNKISIKDKNEVLSVGLPFVLMMLGALVVFFLPEGFGLMSVILLTIPAVLLCFSFMVLSLAFYQDGFKASIWNCISWFFLAVTLLLFLAGGFDFYTKIEAAPVSLPYVTLKASIIFLFLSIITTRTDPGREQMMDLSVLPTSVKDLKDAEEEGEYNRLLTVVERERQMMAELRQIDARRRKDMQKAKESADEANRAKSAFLAVISHEIRTPMTGIMGLVRLLMDTPLTSEQQKYAKSIMESGESMTLLLNDILDFEKIETGKMSLEQTFFDVKQVVQSTATLMAGHAQNKNIYLSVEVHPKAPLNIKGDPSRLRQVLLNLVGNAIKFTEEGGVTIHLKKGARNEDSEEDDKTLHPFCIEIEDTGIGIAKGALEDLFNPFSQADQSIAGKYGGSGLGLAICQRLVELMGGEITVESTPDKGSVFTIHLLIETKEGESENKVLERIDYTKVKSGESTTQAPVEEVIEPEEEKVSVPYEEVDNPNAQKILVVEDNLVSQQVIESFLKKQGHDVTACNNAEDALILAKDAEFDIVFMDWELPGMSGPEAIKQIKSEKGLFITHTVLLTGHRVSIEETGLDETQLAAIINKPVMPEDLEKVIEALIHEEPDVRPIETKSPQEEALEAAPAKTTDSDSSSVPKQPRPAPEDDKQERATPWNYKQSVQNERPPILDEIESLQAVSEEPVATDQEQAEEQTDAPAMTAEEPQKSVWENDAFDQQMINSLLETLGEEKVRELLQNVFEKTDEILVDLKAALETNNVQEINLRAHELKGMAGNFALLQIHDLAEDLEEDVKTKAGAGAADLLKKIHETHLSVKDAVSNS